MFGSLSGERRTVGADFLIYNNTGIPVRLAMGEDTHTHTHLNGKHSCWGAKAHLDHMNSQGRTEIKVWIALHASNWATCNTHSHVTACHVYFSSFSANVKLILDFLNRLILFLVYVQIVKQISSQMFPLASPGCSPAFILLVSFPIHYRVVSASDRHSWKWSPKNTHTRKPILSLHANRA